MAHSQTPLHRERLWPGIGLWATTVFFALGVGVAVLPADPLAALGGAIAVLVTGVALSLVTSPLVAVEEGELCAGRAHVPVELLGSVEALDARATRAALGPELDARAHVLLRGWIPTAVRVTLEYPRDPTPYWLVSSRRAGSLAAAIEAARSSSAP